MSAATAVAPRVAAPAARGGSRSSLAGLASCLRLAWRRSRIYWTLWVLILMSFLPATLSKYHELVPDGSSGKATLDMLAANLTMRAMLGQPYDITTPGGFAFWRVGEFAAAAAGMMAGWGVVRLTRSEEEDGRVELVRSGAVGRHAPLAAAIILGLLACAALGILTTASMAALTKPLAGAVASGLSLATTGAMFVGVGAVMAQVFSVGRAATAWTLGVVLGGLYLLRAVVDTRGDNSPAQWAMPLDWSALARPYAGERGWVYALPLAVAVLLIGLAFWLENHRDHGAGLVQAKPGRAAARPGLRGAQTLALRLQRGGLEGWGVGIAVGALVMGSLALSMDSIVGTNANVEAMLRKMGGGTGALRDSFFQAMLMIMIGLIAVMGVVMLSRLRGEETHGRAEPVLATATSRTGFAWSHLSIALVASSLALLATGPLLGAAAAAKEHDAGLIWMLFKAGLCLWPGLILILGLAMFLHGWAPRLHWIVWAVIGWTLFVSWIGALLNLPQWASTLQPWGHLPHLPSDPVRWPWIVGETLAGLALLALGLVGYRRRDIPR